MNESQPIPRRKLLAATVAGIGAGLLFATVLYRLISVAELTDPLRIIGFALLFGSMLYANRKQAKGPMNQRPDSNV